CGSFGTSYYALFCVFCVCLVFFFSSRRRHSDLVSDWSSDVCSSDLMAVPTRVPVPRRSSGRPSIQGKRSTHSFVRPCFGPARPRSEERRVGKEFRSRGGP